MTLLDSYAVVAYLRDEPAAEQVSRLLAAGDCFLTSVGLADVVDHLVRLTRVDEEEAALDLAQLGLIEARAVDAALGLAAGLLRARHYHRTRCAISMADAVAAVTARATGHPLATADPHLLDVCHAESIALIALPATDGLVWSPPSDA